MAGRYLTVEGGKIWYECRGRRGDCAIVLLHGGPGYPHDYLEPFAALEDQYRLIFYDQLGCGRSDRPQNDRLWTIERFRDELDALLNELKLSRAHFLGHSWGSILAVEYYFRYPEKVQSLLLASPCLSIPRWAADAAELRKLLPKNVQDVLNDCEARNVLYSPDYQKATAEYYRNFVCRVRPKPAPVVRSDAQAGVPVYTAMWGPNEFVVTGSLAGYDCSAKLAEIKAPVLVTCGLLDECQPETAEYYCSLIPGAELHVFQNSSHMPHWEEKTRCIERVRAFLEKACR